jgi:hypothetical protein
MKKNLKSAFSMGMWSYEKGYFGLVRLFLHKKVVLPFPSC